MRCSPSRSPSARPPRRDLVRLADARPYPLTAIGAASRAQRPSTSRRPEPVRDAAGRRRLAVWAEPGGNVQVSLERSRDGGATWERASPWLPSTVTERSMLTPAGPRLYRLLLRGRRGRAGLRPARAVRAHDRPGRIAVAGRDRGAAMMPGFVSPLSDLAGWTLSPVPQIEIPKVFATAASVPRPSCGAGRARRRADAGAGRAAPGPAVRHPTVVEVQVDPVPDARPDRRHSVRPAHRSTCSSKLAPPFTFADGDYRDRGRSARVRQRHAGPDRPGPDRARSRGVGTRIAAAIPDPDTGRRPGRPSPTRSMPRSTPRRRGRVLILDHRGRPAEDGEGSAWFSAAGNGGAEHRPDPADLGDLQAALAPLGLPDDPLASGSPVRLRQRSGDVQFVASRMVSLLPANRPDARQPAYPAHRSQALVRAAIRHTPGEQASPLRRYTAAIA